LAQSWQLCRRVARHVLKPDTCNRLPRLLIGGVRSNPARNDDPDNKRNRMMTKAVLLACCVPFMLGVSATAQAQDSVDMAKFTCEQLLQASENSIEAAIWLSGYYNGQRKNTKVVVGQFKKNAELVVAACKDSPKATVMQTIGKTAGKK
jgi:hypothetical protein